MTVGGVGGVQERIEEAIWDELIRQRDTGGLLDAPSVSRDGEYIGTTWIRRSGNTPSRGVSRDLAVCGSAANNGGCDVMEPDRIGPLQPPTGPETVFPASLVLPHDPEASWKLSGLCAQTPATSRGSSMSASDPAFEAARQELA